MVKNKNMKRIALIISFLCILCQSLTAKPKELNILIFGHSFGQDCATYVPGIAKAAGIDNLRICVFYVANCSLSKHYDNLIGDERYGCMMADPGEKELTKRNLLSSDAIRNYRWDYVVLQSALEDNGRYETLQPFLNNLIGEVKKIQEKKFRKAPVFCWNLLWPMSKLVENKPSRETLFYRMSFYDQNSEKMWDAYRETAAKVLESTEVSKVIPVGQAIMDLRHSSLNTPDQKEFTRDGYHLSFGPGRYAAACAFFGFLIAPVYGKTLVGNTFIVDNDDASMTEEETKEIRNSVVGSLAAAGF